MSKLRKKLITVLAVLFCALLTLSVALMIPKNKTAEAYTYIPPTNVAELIDDNGNGTSFNRTNLQTLYGKLVSGATTFDDVKNALSSTSAIHQGNFADPNNVIVEFGGLKWVAVYLSKATTAHAGSDGPDKGKAQNGDVVLTLWLANPTRNSKFNNYWSSGTANGNSGGIYPSNMYGSSYMRAVDLGNGGGYATSENGTLTIASNAQITGSAYAKYATGTLSDYLVAPRYIGWQYEQHAKYDATNSSNPNPNQYINFDLNNDAWGVGNSTANGFLGGISYEDRAAYAVWKDDLVWLPSITEVGSISSSTTAGGRPSGAAISGLWKISETQREFTSGNYAWSRSAYTTYTGSAGTSLADTGKGVMFQNAWIANTITSGDSLRPVNMDEFNLYVRPAIHLNLTVADESRGIDFGPTGTTVTDENDVKIAAKEGTYNGSAYTINVPDYDYLTATGDTSFYTDTTGVFSVTNPNESSDKTYEITVTPDSDHVWKNTAFDKRREPRKYRIKIKLAEITVGWNPAPDPIASGESVLQDTDDITVQGSQTIVQKFYVIGPNSNETSPPPEDQWTERTPDTESEFLSSDTGTYHVYYKITAKYHKPKEGDYEISVGTDTMRVTFDGDAAIATAAKYADGNALKLTETNQDWLKRTIRNKVTMTPSTRPDTPYSASEKETLFNDLKVIIYKYNGNTRVTASPNDRGYYDVGTYYFGLQYKDGVSGSFTFTWDPDGNAGKLKYPTFTVEKRLVNVEAVASADNGSLTHAYGDEPVKMKWKILSGAAQGEDETHLGLVEDYFITKETGDELDSHTAAGTYHIEGEETESGNYSVTFESSPYEITKREVTLQVADETTEYGVDFSSYSFKPMTVAQGNIVSGDSLTTLTSGVVYSLKFQGTDADTENLFIAEYELYASIESDNYKFTILPGKFTVEKGNFDMSGVTLVSKGYVYDGNPHAAQYSGTLPSDEITVSYRYVNTADGSESTEAPTEIGLYLVYASFSHTNSNYNEINDKVAYIRIAATAEEANQPFPNLPTDEDIAAAADLAKKKDEAKKTLDEEAKKKKDEIDADVNLTPEEKKVAKDEIDEELKKGNEAIDKAKDKDGVNKAYDDGKKEIEDTAELVEKKGAAKSELDKAAQAKKDAIDNNPDLTDEEKQAAKDKVDEELAKGKAEIDGATNVSGVQSVESTTKTNIENIKPEHSGSFPWWILAVIAGAILLVTVLIIVIVKRRNAEDDDDGYDDFYDDEYDYEEEEESDDGDEAFGY